MAITYERIPANLRVPGVYTEISNRGAAGGGQMLEYRRLLIGTMLSTGQAVANVPAQCLSVADAERLAGRGSVLAGMVAAAIAQDSFTDLWVLPLADPSVGAQATATITVTGPATASGTLNLLIAGRKIQVGVANADTATVIATKIVSAVTGDGSLPVTASAADGVVTLKARNKGETGNSLDARINYFQESAPAGTTYTITAFTGGTGNPDLSDALAGIGGSWFQAWASAYSDAGNLLLLENEQNERWGPLSETEGHVFAAIKGTVAALGTIGNARNSEHLTLVGATAEPMPAYEKAAETMSIWAFAVSNDPARPVQNLGYVWCLPAAEGDRLTLQERNVLLYDGIATTDVTAGGVMQAERLITTYKENEAGGVDPSYLDSETLATLLYLRHNLKDRIETKYPRSKLADDGNRFGAGQDIVTPKSFKAELVAWATEMLTLGLIENIDTFKTMTIVERNLTDRNRLDSLVVPDLVNQLRIIALKTQFIL